MKGGEIMAYSPNDYSTKEDKFGNKFQLQPRTDGVKAYTNASNKNIYVEENGVFYLAQNKNKEFNIPLIGKKIQIPLKKEEFVEVTGKIGGKRRTKRRRQRSNKKRTNRRKKTKTRMKKRKTHKRKTNKRRRKR